MARIAGYRVKFTRNRAFEVPLALEGWIACGRKRKSWNRPAINEGVPEEVNNATRVALYGYVSVSRKRPRLTQFVRGVLIESERHRARESDFERHDGPTFTRPALD